jgi:hypothetical protein
VQNHPPAWRVGIRAGFRPAAARGTAFAEEPVQLGLRNDREVERR